MTSRHTHSRRRNRVLAAGAAAVVAGSGLAVAATPALAASSDLVISQVYGGGGNAGAPLTNDFIELTNRGTAAVSVDGWSVQYASAAGTSWQVTALTGSIPAGSHYLIQEAAGSAAPGPLPAPDATGTIAMSAASGKVALVTSTTALTCGSACSTAAGVRDFIGYGAANDAETAAAPGLSNATADLRSSPTDTDNNAADFAAAPPAPQACGAACAAPPPPPADPHPIHDIQGAAQTSPLVGQRVATTGVVTAKASNGFYLQDPSADTNPATSEGIFVFTSPAAVSVGDAVKVTATVSEFRPGGAATNLTTTELTTATVEVTSIGNPLPATTIVGRGGRVPPQTVIEDDSNGDVAVTEATFDPAHDGIDFWESLEGMRVQINDAQAVGPTNSFDETPIVSAGAASVRSNRGGVVLREDDPNPERVVLASTLAATPSVDVGARYTTPVVGVIDYNFGNFFLEATTTPAATGGVTPEVTKPARSGQLTIGTFNVENLSPVDPPAKFARLAQQVVTNLRAPLVLAVEEIQDNDGPLDNGVVDADRTFQQLIDAIRAAGGPVYSWTSINPAKDQDGGQPGGNIRVGFLYQAGAGVSLAPAPAGDTTTAETITGRFGNPHLALNPGRIAPTDPAWAASRKPLAAEFVFRGKNVFVIANHLVSKLGDDPLYGRTQPPQFPSETKRTAQAALLHDFVGKLLTRNPLARVVVVGDLNDFPWSNAVQTLSRYELLDLPATLPVAERYTYVYEGNSEVLDHILLSPWAALSGFSYDVVHVNAEFADQTSDHDPQVVSLTLR